MLAYLLQAVKPLSLNMCNWDMAQCLLSHCFMTLFIKPCIYNLITLCSFLTEGNQQMQTNNDLQAKVQNNDRNTSYSMCWSASLSGIVLD